MGWDRNSYIVLYRLPNIEIEVVLPTRDPGKQTHAARARKQELRWNKRSHVVDAPGLANNPAAEAPRHPSSRTTGLIKGGDPASDKHFTLEAGRWLAAALRAAFATVCHQASPSGCLIGNPGHA